MLTIPEIRDELIELFAAPYCPQAIASRGKELVSQMYRRKPEKVAPRKSEPMTVAKKKEILELSKAYPGKSIQWIATRANVNAGRVSEVLRGKRK